jgi:hypothetical protein
MRASILSTAGDPDLLLDFCTSLAWVGPGPTKFQAMAGSLSESLSLSLFQLLQLAPVEPTVNFTTNRSREVGRSVTVELAGEYGFE